MTTKKQPRKASTQKLNIALGCDHAAVALKDFLKSCFSDRIQWIDCGTHSDSRVDYPDYAKEVASVILSKKAKAGVLVCGTGIGMSIAANKVKGIRAALVHDMFSARATRQHNNSNVLAMGERVIGPSLGREIAKVWLETEFEGDRHNRRIEKIHSYEEK